MRLVSLSVNVPRPARLPWYNRPGSLVLPGCAVPCEVWELRESRKTCPTRQCPGYGLIGIAHLRMAYDRNMTSAHVKNQFLLAMPNLLVAGDYFRDTITYVCDHNDKGAMGIVVNRPLKLTVADVLEQLELPNTGDVEAVVLEGGPVQRNAAIILHSDDVRIEKSVGVGDGLALTAEVEMLAAIGRGEGPSQYVVALGYAGWASGQLDGELAANTWLTCRGSKSLIFEVPFEERVETAAKTLGIDFSLMSGQSGNA